MKWRDWPKDFLRLKQKIFPKIKLILTHHAMNPPPTHSSLWAPCCPHPFSLRKDKPPSAGCSESQETGTCRVVTEPLKEVTFFLTFLLSPHFTELVNFAPHGPFQVLHSWWRVGLSMLGPQRLCLNAERLVPRTSRAGKAGWDRRPHLASRPRAHQTGGPGSCPVIATRPRFSFRCYPCLHRYLGKPKGQSEEERIRRPGSAVVTPRRHPPDLLPAAESTQPTGSLLTTYPVLKILTLCTHKKNLDFHLLCKNCVI